MTERERRRLLRKLGEAIAWFERKHGVITVQQMEDAKREMRSRSIKVRGREGATGPC